MSELLNKLNEFQGANGLNFKERLESLDKMFKEIAKIMLYKGLLVFNGKSVYIRDVEFYYHEENGIMKDPIMYHVNEKDNTKEYFEVGTFNLHISGVDITFESKGRYRASALIRGFSVDDPNGKVDGRSTFLYDYFVGLSPFNNILPISWKEEKIDAFGDIRNTFRRNVPFYRKKGDNIIVLKPDFMSYGKKAYEPIPWNENPPSSTVEEVVVKDIRKTATSNKLQDTIHLWRFYRHNELKGSESL